MKLFVMLVLLPNALTYLDQELILNFLQFKHLRFGYIFHCSSKQETLLLSKFLSQRETFFAKINVENETANIKLNSGVIVDADCTLHEDLLEMAKIFPLEDSYHWLITATNLTFLEQYTLPLNINTDLFIAIPDEDEDKTVHWLINDVFNPAYKHGGKLKISEVGVYSKQSGFQVPKQSRYWTRRNMTGVLFKTMHVIPEQTSLPPEEYFQCENNHRPHPFVRFQYQLTKHCREFYNFSMDEQPTTNWGYIRPDGTIDGLVEALQFNRVDFGSTGLFLKHERLERIDFATGLWRLTIKVAFRQPSFRSFDDMFLKPMEASAWLTIAAAAVLILVALKVNQNYEYGFRKLQDSLDSAWSTTTLFILGAFCQQGFPQTPTRPSGRMITITILVFCLITYQFYSGSVVSFLLTSIPPSINTPTDLLESPLEMGTFGAPYVKDYYDTTIDPTAKQIYKTKLQTPKGVYRVFDPSEGLRRLEQGGFAYQMEEAAMHILMKDILSDKTKCELGEILVVPAMVNFTPVPKHSVFRDMLSYCMLRMAEHGIGDYNKRRCGSVKPQCLKTAASITIEVTFTQIYPAIVLLFLGILASLVVLGYEIYSKKKKNLTEKVAVNKKMTFNIINKENEKCGTT